MPAFRQLNTQSLELGTEARALTGLGRSSLLKLGLAARAFSFTDGGHYFRLLSTGPTYGGRGGTSSIPILCVASAVESSSLTKITRIGRKRQGEPPGQASPLLVHW